MCDEWMPRLELALSPEQFQELPRNAAYRYDYLNGQAWLSPRPRYYHALLDLRPFANAPAPTLPRVLRLRTLLWPDDWDALAAVFAAAFRGQQPFAALDDSARMEAARKSLVQTRDGGDGPWIAPASFLADEGGQLLGAMLLTLLPATDAAEPDSYYWSEPPPADALARLLGRPHLTWAFVAPNLAGRGVGTALLHATARALLELGYAEMASTFLLGNESSMLWHWRVGFRLQPYPLSWRSPALDGMTAFVPGPEGT